MEQRLDATYLRPGLFERAATVGIGTLGIGVSILLAAWGISFLWHYTPPEIVVRQHEPFRFAPLEPLKIDPGASIKVEAPPALIYGGGGNAKTARGEVITREVTVFSSVGHSTGHVTTGWTYRDGAAGVPVRQYCYYSAPNIDASSTKIDIAFDRARASNISASIPDLEGALAKCQWWQG
jgi:hypothetical protein